MSNKLDDATTPLHQRVNVEREFRRAAENDLRNASRRAIASPPFLPCDTIDVALHESVASQSGANISFGMSVLSPMQPSPMQPSKSSGTSISNASIIVTAVTCLLGLIVLIGGMMLVNVLTNDPLVPDIDTVEPDQKELEEALDQTYFREGYAMVVPTGFRTESREATENGSVIYRFLSDDGCRFTLAIVPDETIDRFTSPPADFSQTLVPGVRELSQDIDGEVDPARVWVDGMSAALFRFYEKETFRGVNFTYCMVVMDRGRKLVLKIAGKYGAHSEREEYIAMPEHWYDALLTFRHIRRDEERYVPKEDPQTQTESVISSTNEEATAASTLSHEDPTDNEQ